jgi:hypothetical protein
MAFGDVTVTLRPIKFAFLVNPLERKELDRAIQVSLFLWGGLHNPIIPIYRRLPSGWSDLPTERPAASEICKGYVRTFDPDAIVVCGGVDKSVIPAHIQHIITLDELAGDLSKEDAPALGVGLFEVLANFAQEEFRYVRRDGMKVLMPSYEDSGSTLFRAVFGEIPKEAKRETYDALLKSVDIDQPRVNLENFLQVIRQQSTFLSSLCANKLEFRRPRTERASAVFLMDHLNALDIIDFWNLRAIGWHVLPVPTKLSGLADTRDYVRRFIDRQTAVGQPTRGLNDAVILKARSVPQAEFTTFVDGVPRAAGQSLAVQIWYPPMWDEFARRGGRLTCSSIAGGQVQTQVSDETSRIRIKALAPEFMASNLGHGARYANDIKISIYGRTQFGAEVLPPYEKNVSRLFGIGLLTDWRIGPSGLTFLGRFADWTIQLNQPAARDVVSLTLADRGWKEFRFSSSGNVAYQMMKHLGGPQQIGLIQNLKLIQLLDSLAIGRDTGEEERLKKRIDKKLGELAGRASTIATADAKRIVRDEIEKSLRSSSQGGDVTDGEFFGHMKRIANSQLFPSDVHRLAEAYTEAKIFHLGVRLQCDVCKQHSWYPLEDIKHELQCPICLSAFKLPTHNPGKEIRWSYKSLGPFALPKQGFGAYSVLLTVHFLCTHQRPATTPIFSFHATRNGKELEADFMMFYRNSAFWEHETETIFGECKSFNGFADKDVRRMRTIAADNPGSVLVFSTLATEFSAHDKKVLLPFVRACRKYGGLDRPKNPILLLTGTELFSPFGPPQCWRNAGGAKKAFADSGVRLDTLLQLCDATQQLYLGLPSWWQDWEADFKKRQARRAT